MNSGSESQEVQNVAQVDSEFLGRAIKGAINWMTGSSKKKDDNKKPKPAGKPKSSGAKTGVMPVVTPRPRPQILGSGPPPPGFSPGAPRQGSPQVQKPQGPAPIGAPANAANMAPSPYSDQIRSLATRNEQSQARMDAMLDRLEKRMDSLGN